MTRQQALANLAALDFLVARAKAIYCERSALVAMRRALAYQASARAAAEDHGRYCEDAMKAARAWARHSGVSADEFDRAVAGLEVRLEEERRGA